MKFPEKIIVRHRNCTAYKIVFGHDVVKLEATGEPGYAYRAAGGFDNTSWVREQGDMESEGRFALVSEGPPSP